MSRLVALITSLDPQVRDRPLAEACEDLTPAELLAECAALDEFRRNAENLYERVRALFFLYALHRFILPAQLAPAATGGTLPYEGVAALQERRFTAAIDRFREELGTQSPSGAVNSALASAYFQAGLQNLADQVRHSVRDFAGNRWMFEFDGSKRSLLRFREMLLAPSDGRFPVLREQTAVRLDLSHSGWSDIFFLGMDAPERARVLNISVDLAVHGRDRETRPPVQAFLRVIDTPVLRITSIDLAASAELREISQVFAFAKDHLGLLRAAIVASGIVPIGLEGSSESLSILLEPLVGEGRGLELTSSVNDIPKGSRLAVSTNLLGCLISTCMRATGQTRSLSGPLLEDERRLVAARAILGEWLGGSGGGWQDSGGLWPGIKRISGARARPGDTEFGISRGRLLPEHEILGEDRVGPEARAALEQSLVLVHGGIAQNVGPILEMVTEKYLLRSQPEWDARLESGRLFDEIETALCQGEIRRLASLTTEHFFGPLQTIVPWATTRFTEELIDALRSEFGDAFWGFLMLGGMSGGGMGLFFDPQCKPRAMARTKQIMDALEAELRHALPFAMRPVVYDFRVNERGSSASLLIGAAATPPEVAGQHATTSDPTQPSGAPASRALDLLLEQNGFDVGEHERIRSALQSGAIGLARNRLSQDARVEDVRPEDVCVAERDLGAEDLAAGQQALRAGEIAVVTLAAGAASRWTEGSGVVKALHPFCKFAGKHRSFLDIHLAKSRATYDACGTAPLHVLTTGYSTHAPIAAALDAEEVKHAASALPAGTLYLSRGRSIGLRLIPTSRDLRFEWREVSEQLLDERAQKMREGSRDALLTWAMQSGEAEDYRDNLPLQCVHPLGHAYEVPNLLLNGTLQVMLEARPQLRTLMMHNIDTLGVDLDPQILGRHRAGGSGLSFEVVARQLEDRGGGLARIDGKLRLVEGLALPREALEFELSYYNTGTCWIEIDAMLAAMGLARGDLANADEVRRSVRRFCERLPTYVTHKEVKKRWGHGHEDVFPVAQFERLWGDVTALDDPSSAFIAVPRKRGQQLKQQGELDGWLRDGSYDYVAARCRF